MVSRLWGRACGIVLITTVLLACVATGALPGVARAAETAAQAGAGATGDVAPATDTAAPTEGAEAKDAVAPVTKGAVVRDTAKPLTDTPTPTGKPPADLTKTAVPAAVAGAPANTPTAPGTEAAVVGEPPSLTLGGKPPKGGVGPSLSAGGGGGLLRRMGLFQGLQITGSNSYTFQRNTIEGAQDAFEGQRWDTGSTVRQSSLHLEGPVWRNFGFQADLSSSGYGPSYSRVVWGFVTKNTGLYYGDLNVQLAGNEFLQFSKTVKGWQLDQRLPHNGLLRAFKSEEKGFVRNQSFVGNNTYGPYFLTYTPVVDGSEVVKVDERPMKFGRDYRIDYDTGQLSFDPVGGATTVVPATSTISVSYQSAGYQDSPGSLTGWRLELPLFSNDRMLVGVTKLSQQRSVGGSLHRDTAGYQEDVYNGSGSTGPFDTNFRPILGNGAAVVYKGQSVTIAQPLTVLVDAVEQKEAIDYDSYRQIGRIIFRRAVPPTSLVVIRYYYSVAQTFSSGDQDVTGVDLSYRVTKDLSLRTDFARSVGGTSGGEGSAVTTTLTLTRPTYRINYNYRNMDPTFSYIDSVGFRTLEKGTTLSADWRPKSWLSLHGTQASTMSATGSSFGYSGYGGGYGFGTSAASLSALVGVAQTSTSSTSLNVENSRREYGVQLNVPKWPTLDYTVQSMTNGGTSSLGGSDYTTKTMRMQYNPQGKPYTLSWQSTSNEQSYLGLSGTTGTKGVASGSSTRQTQASFTYNPGTRLSLSATIGKNSSTDSAGTNNSSATNRQYTLRYTPSERLSFSIDRTTTESLGLVTSGLYSSYNSYYSGGTSIGNIGGLNGGTGLPVTGTTGDSTQSMYTDDSSRFMVTWQPLQKISLNYASTHRTYTSAGSVGYLADSDQTNQTLGLSWQFSEAMSLTGGLSRDNMRFLDANRGTVASNMLTLGANYKRANSRWGIGLNYTQQVGSSPTYINFGAAQIMRIVPTDLHDLQARLTCDTGSRSSLYATTGVSDFDSGYSAFTKNTTEVGWAYRVSGLTNLTLGYRYIRSLNTLSASGLPGYYGSNPAGQDYIANTFLMTLSTNFHTGVGGSDGPPSASGGMMPGGGSFGGSGTFGGYRAGIGGFNGYGAGTTMQSMSGFGGLGSTFGGGNTYGGLGGNTGSLGGFGTSGEFGSGTIGIPGFGSGTSGTQQSYGTGFYSSGATSGFKTGLGDFQQKTPEGSGTTSSGMGSSFSLPPSGQTPRGGQGPPGTPGQPGGLAPDPNAAPDWQLLDDGRSRWW
jgi:hypothetical protein